MELKDYEEIFNFIVQLFTDNKTDILPLSRVYNETQARFKIERDKAKSIIARYNIDGLCESVLQGAEHFLLLKRFEKIGV